MQCNMCLQFCPSSSGRNPSPDYLKNAWGLFQFSVVFLAVTGIKIRTLARKSLNKFLFKCHCLYLNCWHEPFTSLREEVIKTHQHINPARITLIFLSLKMTQTQFYYKDESKVTQEGFFQIPFPHLPNAASSYSTFTTFKTKTGSLRAHHIHCS